MGNKGNRLTESQKDQVCTWIRAGYTAPQIVLMAKNIGFEISADNIWNNYMPKVRAEFKDHMLKNQLAGSWFNKEFRAEKAAEIAEMLYGKIMEGAMFGEEVTVKEDRRGNEITTTKPVYFAGMIKNWKDLVDTISMELGQRKQQVDVNFNKNQNMTLSVLIDKIYEADGKLDKDLEDAEIIDLPPGDDFADDKGFMAIVDQPEEIKEIVESAKKEEAEDDWDVPF